MSKQLRLDKSYLRIAQVWAENSQCERKKVGCVMIKNQTIVADGYNGTPSGFDNTCQDATGKTFPYVLHAEANAITKVAKSNNSSDGATLYITINPCVECAKLIIQAGIVRVVYADFYKNYDGLLLLEQSGVEVEQIKI